MRRRTHIRFPAVLIVFGLISPTLEAQAQNAQRGLAFARVNCAGCHAIERQGDSPLKEAPAFRVLHKRYPVDTLAEALAEGITTGHPVMPEFKLNPSQIGDLIAFLKTLE